MFFVPIIDKIGIRELARALNVPAKNVRRWIDSDSIPADWFMAVVKAARHLGHRDVSVSVLAETAERRRLAKDAA